MFDRPHPLLQVSLDLTASLTAEDRYRRIVEAVREVIPAEGVLITRLTAEGLRPVAYAGADHRQPAGFIPLGSGPMAQLVETARPVRLRADDPELSTVKAARPDLRVGAFLGVGLRVEDEVVGTLAMVAGDEGAFDLVPDDTVLAFSALTAAALRTASLLDTLERERDVLRDHMALEALVLDISTRFINVPVDHIGAAINKALRRVGEFAGADRCYLFMSERSLPQPGLSDDMALHLLHEWCADGIEPGSAAMQRALQSPALAAKHIAAKQWLLNEVMQRHTLRVPDIDQLDKDAPGRFRWGQQGCRSVLVIPLELGPHAIGVVGFDAVRECREWDDHTVMLLRTVGHILASAVERRRSAEALRQAHADLERKVNERTQELRKKQGQLVQSEKMAALGQLVAGIAHEVNTPLGAIKSNNDTLSRTFARLREQLSVIEPLPGRVASLLEIGARVCAVSEDAIARITRIMGSMRNFARLDLGDVETVDLRQCIESTLVLVNHMLKGRIRVERAFGELPPVECHASQINQVFMNLFVNAAQAIPGKGTLRIAARGAGQRVEITIDDDGVGIARDHMPRIFDPGFTTKGVGVGTGLGLAIVHQIMEEHRGRIEVHSVPGEGTRVTLTLPVQHPH